VTVFPLLQAQYISCNLCGSNDYRVLFPAGKAQSQQIVQCLGCGLMYTNPRTEELDFVRVANSDPAFLNEMLQRSYDPRMEKERRQVKDYETTRDILADLFPARGNLLEVGSGLGFLLQLFKQDGWITTGVEPDPLCCEHARAILGLDVIAGTLPNAKCRADSYDVALMLHVIEHVPDPCQTLSELFGMLRPGGIVVVETPRYDTLAFKLLGHRERSVLCEGHVYFFTTSTLERIARKVGFSVLRHAYVGRSLTLDRLLWNIGRISKIKVIQSKLESISRLLRLTEVRLKHNNHDMQRVYLTPQCQAAVGQRKIC
jgi:2-polyprenyl-3-methyl-5-hydroxy-6-metoxy-1,4-benzoquinol methylase